ncbi:hypothetical protein [Rhodovarius crocodyli]|uniref:hypothetical protein n=1 Tax=Rhodovarius crocodyli TaxID=1979269 RepID=UPI0013E3B6E8|nr:hypothetical protein [Rhodovarius crocodyli]
MTFWIAFGWFGFGAVSGNLPELRLGIVAFGCSWGLITETMREGIRKAMRALGRHA